MSDADFVITLPSQIISDVMEKFFNSEMFKKEVKVIELKANDDMCRFELEWVGMQAMQVPPFDSVLNEMLAKVKPTRTHNGKFAKKDHTNG